MGSFAELKELEKTEIDKLDEEFKKSLDPNPIGKEKEEKPAPTQFEMLMFRIGSLESLLVESNMRLQRIEQKLNILPGKPEKPYEWNG